MPLNLLSQGQISVSSIANTEGVTIEIADNGIGMSEATYLLYSCKISLRVNKR
jgi:signal transduction histidine kinase